MLGDFGRCVFFNALYLTVLREEVLFALKLLTARLFAAIIAAVKVEQLFNFYFTQITGHGIFLLGFPDALFLYLTGSLPFGAARTQSIYPLICVFIRAHALVLYKELP